MNNKDSIPYTHGHFDPPWAVGSFEDRNVKTVGLRKDFSSSSLVVEMTVAYHVLFTFHFYLFTFHFYLFTSLYPLLCPLDFCHNKFDLLV